MLLWFIPDFSEASADLQALEGMCHEGFCQREAKLTCLCHSSGAGCPVVLAILWTSPVVQMVKNQPAMPETCDQSLGRDDPLEKGMATQSSILAWRSPLTEEPGGLPSVGLQRAGHN